MIIMKFEITSHIRARYNAQIDQDLLLGCPKPSRPALSHFNSDFIFVMLYTTQHHSTQICAVQLRTYVERNELSFQLRNIILRLPNDDIVHFNIYHEILKTTEVPISNLQYEFTVATKYNARKMEEKSTFFFGNRFFFAFDALVLIYVVCIVYMSYKWYATYFVAFEWDICALDSTYLIIFGKMVFFLCWSSRLSDGKVLMLVRHSVSIYVT